MEREMAKEREAGQRRRRGKPPIPEPTQEAADLIRQGKKKENTRN